MALETLRSLFSLKPYGRNLLDGTAKIWMVLAGLNILSIAFCDAVAWGYFGYTTAHGPAAYATAAIAFLLVITLVGSLDAMFVMHDRSDRRNAVREWLAVGARVILVILTFTITAPFLTQLFFARDIEAAIKRRNEATIGAKRTEIASRLEARQGDLEKEIAGRGSSGRYGRGPTAEAIEREIGVLQNEIRTFDDAVKSPEVLANRYGIDLVREGPDTRARVIAELEQSESFRATRRTIKAFLVFMFLGLVCLKLFQPDSVRVYYSAKLQAEYARMQAGLFDHRFDPREAQSGLTPIRFADWYENDQQVRDATDRLREQTSLAIERLKVHEDAVRVMHDTLRTDMVRMNEELAATGANNDELEKQVAAARHEVQVLQAKIAEQQQALDDFRYDSTEELSLGDQQLLISSRNKTARTLAENRAAAATMIASLQRLEARLETSRAYEAQLRETLAASGNEVAALSKALQEARQSRVADIFAAR
jgi:hypothetical protein